MLIRNHTKHFGSFSIKHWMHEHFFICKFCIFYFIFVANPRQKMAHCGGMIGGEKPAIPGLSPLPSFHTNPIFQLDLPLALFALELDKIEN